MPEVKKVSKSLLKAKMLEYFREVEKSGIELIVTDNNRPVLSITPIQKTKATVDSVFKKFRKKVKYRGDLTAPTSDEWGDL